jgi:hypothetical protein
MLGALPTMNDPNLSALFHAHLEEFIAAFAVLVSFAALVYSSKSAKASQRSADAAEEANEHSKISANAAAISVQMNQKAFENEAKRSKAYAYWRLYRITNMLDASGSAGIEKIKDDLSPIQEYLHVYGHMLQPEDREHIRIALNGIELLIADIYDQDQFQKIRGHITEAALALREEWM